MHEKATLKLPMPQQTKRALESWKQHFKQRAATTVSAAAAPAEQQTTTSSATEEREQVQREQQEQATTSATTELQKLKRKRDEVADDDEEFSSLTQAMDKLLNKKGTAVKNLTTDVVTCSKTYEACKAVVATAIEEFRQLYVDKMDTLHDEPIFVFNAVTADMTKIVNDLNNAYIARKEALQHRDAEVDSRNQMLKQLRTLLFTNSSSNEISE